MLHKGGVKNLRGISSATVATLFALTCATPAFAQQKGRMAVGASVGVRTAADSSAAQGKTGVGLAWRFGQSHEGWGWNYGLGWFSTDIARSMGGEDTDLGRLRVLAPLVGYGYTHVMGRKSISANLVGGYAFNKLAQEGDMANTLRERFGVGSVDVGNTPVLRPGVSAWYNVNDKIGIQVGAHYTVARPRVTVTSPAGTDAGRLKADMFGVKIGMVYSIF